MMRLLAVMAFTAWGLSQLFAGSRTAGLLDDAAILLFVVDAGSAVISDARKRLRGAHPAAPETEKGTSAK